MPFERYVQKGARRLRLGYTTGTCAALAAGAAARMALGGGTLAFHSVVTPGGLRVEAGVEDVEVGDGSAACSVRKDAGDDPDVTDGILVRARVEKIPGGAVAVDGGAGVGRVTRRGLDQPVGAAAINRVPRMMIEEEVRRACRDFGYGGGMAVTVSIPGGAEIAEGTFNPVLGVEGGLSVLGTSGIVEPMSVRAIVGTIEAELRALRAEGARNCLAVPGRHGARFARACPALAGKPAVTCSNFIGETLDMAAAMGFAGVLAVGHLGKLVKLAGGVMDTHSRTADCRLELMALHAALAGADGGVLREVLAAATTDAALETLDSRGLRAAVVRGVLDGIDRHLARRTGNGLLAGAAVFDGCGGLLGMTAGAEALLARWEDGDV